MKETFKDKILNILPTINHKFTCVDIAEIIGAKINMPCAYETAPYITKLLTELCKEGILYQRIIGVGGMNDLSDYAPKWEMWYIRCNTDLAKELLKKRELNGYRFR